MVGGQELLGVQRVALGPRQHRTHHRRVGRPVGAGGDDARDVVAVQPAEVDASGPGGPADLGQASSGTGGGDGARRCGRSARAADAPRAVRDSAAAKSWVERSAQCMSSSTSSTGPAAAASRTAAVRSSNTWNASRLRGASGSSRVSIRRADGRDSRSSTPPSRDRTASTTGANEMPASMSRPCPVATVNPSSAARRSRSATSVVLPIPASPPTSTICGVPCAANPRASSNSAMSRSRPSSREGVTARYGHAVHRPRRGWSESPEISHARRS